MPKRSACHDWQGHRPDRPGAQSMNAGGCGNMVRNNRGGAGKQETDGDKAEGSVEDQNQRLLERPISSPAR